MSEERSASLGEVEYPSLEGIGGWLLVPVLNLFLAIVVCIFVVAKTVWSGGTLLGFAPMYAAVAAAYSAICLGTLFERMRLSKYLMLAFYGFALISNFIATFVFHVSAHPIGISAVAPYVRGILEITMILYFVFSERVRRTLVN